MVCGASNAIDCRRRVRLWFSYGGTKYCINTGGAGTALRGVKVMVHHFADDRLRVMYKDRTLALTAYGTYPVPDPGADEKTLDARLEALVAARKPAASIVSGRDGGIKLMEIKRLREEGHRITLLNEAQFWRLATARR